MPTTMLAGGRARIIPALRMPTTTNQANLQGTAAGDYLDPQKNPFFANTTNAIGNDVWNRVSGLYAVQRIRPGLEISATT